MFLLVTRVNDLLYVIYLQSIHERPFQQIKIFLKKKILITLRVIKNLKSFINFQNVHTLIKHDLKWFKFKALTIVKLKK